MLEARMPRSERELSSEAIARAVLASNAWRLARTVFCYVSVRAEVDTHELLLAALEQRKRLCVPQVLSAPGAMQAVLVPDMPALEGMKPGRFGVPHPSGTSGRDHGRSIIPQCEIDLAIVPGVAFDRAGLRVGQGGGYYDRYLAGCPAYRVGLCHPAQLFDDLSPADRWDQPMDAIALPEGLIILRDRREVRRLP
jgi:5-formyltetrahydrofolate cyclo-ligase